MSLDGNVPPDFLVDGRIAVEVRRLNQNEETPTGPRGLEEIEAPLRDKIERLLQSIGSPSAGANWYVLYSFKRPVGPWAALETRLRGSLMAFRSQSNHAPTRLTIDKSFSVRLARAGRTYPTFFVLGGSVDRDSGGWVLSEMDRNLRICVEEKTRKVSQVGHKYAEWWLALVDHIGYGLTGPDREELRELVQMDRLWDKIILVNPLDPRRGFEL
jgi:hypothetical protein